MPLERYYEKQTIKGVLKQKAIEAWPTVYRTINGLFWLLFQTFSSMIKAALNSLQGK